MKNFSLSAILVTLLSATSAFADVGTFSGIGSNADIACSNAKGSVSPYCVSEEGRERDVVRGSVSVASDCSCAGPELGDQEQMTTCVVEASWSCAVR